MQRFYLVEPWKYLAAGLIFLVGSVGLFLNLMNSKLFIILLFYYSIILGKYPSFSKARTESEP
ncbi:MAG: hypothetical protein OEZ34_05680 [Spirochaetia bacterium]|nr:hypothetical protein [Spirochaetia bacterium]